MKVLLVKDLTEVALKTSDLICRQLQIKAKSVFGFPTGTTSIPLYQELIQRENKGIISFTKCTTFNLDEYVGLNHDHPKSYRTFMYNHLFNHIDIKKSRVNVPCGLVNDPQRECAEYEKKIKKAGGIDLQVLGIGENGHIGFNEPLSGLSSRTRLVQLAEVTLKSHRRSFPGGNQPTQALTMGIGTILEARSIVLMAAGTSKADAVASAIEGPVQALCPASALQFHPDVTFIIDREAASELRRKDLFQI